MAGEIAMQQALHQASAAARFPTLSDGLRQVQLPVVPRQPGEAQPLPRKQPKPFQPARNTGERPILAGDPLRHGRDGMALLDDTDAETSADTAGAGAHELPHSHGLIGQVRIPADREPQPVQSETGLAIAYLERERWDEHIVPNHVTNPPEARGKRTTTYWPIVFAAQGMPTMTEEDAQHVTMMAVRDGVYQNAPRGTLLAIYEVPADLELPSGRSGAATGVSEVKVSMAPDGRILSAYPTAGPNVLAIREVEPEEAAEQAVPTPVADPFEHLRTPAMAASGDEDGWTA